MTRFHGSLILALAQWKNEQLYEPTAHVDSDIRSGITLSTASAACLWKYDRLEMMQQQSADTELISGNFLRHSYAFYEWRIVRKPARNVAEEMFEPPEPHFRHGQPSQAVSQESRVAPHHCGNRIQSQSLK